MRRIIVSLSVFLILSLCAFSEQIRVTTWNLNWFPSGTANLAPLEVESKRILDAADILRRISPDIILLQEIRDVRTCEKLAAALIPDDYQVAACSQFKDEIGGVLSRQQTAILARARAFAAWSEPWNTVGIVDPPRGYAFAAFRYGTNDIGVYVVHFKSNLTRGDAERQTQLNILKRELAAEQLSNHVKTVATLLTNDLEVVLIGGDFNTNPDQLTFVSEKTLRLFADDGYSSGFEGVPLARRVTYPTKGRYPDATFDYVFVKGAIGQQPHIFSNMVSDHFPVTRVIETR